MIFLLQEFLLDCLGIFFDLTPEIFNRYVADGVMVAQILFLYNVIDSKLLKLIKPTKDLEQARKNFSYIRVWCKLIGVNIDNNMLTEITECKGISSIKLIYHIYVQLAVKLDFIPHSEEIRGKFKVEKVKEENKESDDVKFTRTTFEFQKLQKKHPSSEMSAIPAFVDKKIYKLMPSCYYHNILKKQFDRITKYWKESSKKKRYRSMDYYALLAESEKTKQAFLKCRNNLNNNNDILLNIKEKKDIIKIKKKYPRCVVHHITETLIESEENEYRFMICSKVLKNSHFEKLIACKNQEITMFNEEIDNHNLETAQDMIEEDKQSYFLISMHSYFETMSAEVLKNSQIRRHLQLEKVFSEAKYGLQHKKNIQMCSEIINVLIDCALSISIKKFKNENVLPAYFLNELKVLFVKGEPIFGEISDLEIFLNDEENIPEHLKEIVKRERERQVILWEAEFDDYLNLKNEWNVVEFFSSFETLGPQVSNILGYIVNKLLLAKYPVPESPEPHVRLPMVEVAGIFMGFNDPKIVAIFDYFLSKNNIKLIQVEAIINSAIKQYKKEAQNNINFDYEDVIMSEKFFKETNSHLKYLQNVRAPNNRWDILTEPKLYKHDCLPDKSNTECENEKAVQTGRKIPYEDYQIEAFTTKAKLGKIILEILDAGEKIPDEIVTDLLLDELKHLPPHKGWLLHNYPVTFKQISLLEEKLTGIPPPGEEDDHDEEELENLMDIKLRRPIEEREKNDLDPNKSHRESKLVPNPKPPPNKRVFRTFFNRYFKIDFSCEDWPQVDSYIERIYKDQNVLFQMNYKVISVSSIELAVNLVTGTIIPPLEKVIEANNCKYIYYGKRKDKYSGEEGKKEEFKSIYEGIEEEKVSIEKIYDEKEREIQEINEELYDLNLQIQKNNLWQNKCESSSEDSYEEDENIKQLTIDELSILLESEIQPGDKLWHYIDGNLSEEVKITLATKWESIENKYINQIQKCSFLKRIQAHYLIHYGYIIRKSIRDLYNAEDERQKHVNKYQTVYNYIYNTDELWRRDKEIKWEFHTRASEMQVILLEIANSRYLESEKERKDIILSNGPNQEIGFHCNLFIRMVQIETDRFTNTLQLLNTYYSMSTHKKFLMEIDDIKLPFLNLKLFNPNLNLETEKGELKMKTSIDPIDFNTFNEKLINKDYFTHFETSPFQLYIQELFEVIKTKTDSIMTKNLKEIKKLQDLNIKKRMSEVMDPYIEWIAAIQNEHLRFEERLTIIYAKAFHDISFIEKNFSDIFDGLQDEILFRYLKEIQSINKLLFIIRKRMENEIPFKYELKLAQEKCIQSRKMLYREDTPKEFIPIQEDFSHFTFSIRQLRNFYKILKKIAPVGYISRMQFLEIVSKIVKVRTNEITRLSVPYVWTVLPIRSINEILLNILGELDYIHPEQLMIAAMNLPMPTIEDILYYRNQFRNMDPEHTDLIPIKEFLKTELWFEKKMEFLTSNEKYRLFLAKNLICILFRVNRDYLNYAKFLLEFCEDDVPQLGLIKALTLVMGKFIINSCYDYVVPTSEFSSSHLEESKNDFWDSLSPSELKATPYPNEESVKEEEIHSDFKLTFYDDVEEEIEEEIVNEKPLLELFPEFENLEDLTEELFYSGCDLSVATSTLSSISSPTVTDSLILMEEEKLSESSDSLSLGSHIWTNLIPFEAMLIVLNNCFPWFVQTKFEQDSSITELLERVYKDLGAVSNSVDSISLLQHQFIHDICSRNTRFKHVNFEEVTANICKELSIYKYVKRERE